MVNSHATFPSFVSELLPRRKGEEEDFIGKIRVVLGIFSCRRSWSTFGRWWIISGRVDDLRDVPPLEQGNFSAPPPFR